MHPCIIAKLSEKQTNIIRLGVVIVICNCNQLSGCKMLSKVGQKLLCMVHWHLLKGSSAKQERNTLQADMSTVMTRHIVYCRCNVLNMNYRYIRNCK